MKYQTRLIPVMATCFFVCTFIHGQGAKGSAVQGKADNQLRYVIIENTLDDGNDRRRHVEILMEAKAFSEKNLRTLFELVSKRFAEPEELLVTVYTSLEQAPTPEERDLGGTSNAPPKPRQKLYYWALYLRTPDDEYFRYSPLRDKSDNVLIQIK